MVKELRHGEWKDQPEVDIKTLRENEKFVPTDVTIHDIKRLEAGDGCRGKISRVENRWVFGQFTIWLGKCSKEPPTNWAKNNETPEEQGYVENQTVENAANEWKQWKARMGEL